MVLPYLWQLTKRRWKRRILCIIVSIARIGQYWGEQPGTSGPVYVGAFVMFLFVLGLFIVKGPMKWALLSATVLSVLLSWGKNFMGFTDFFFGLYPDVR